MITTVVPRIAKIYQNAGLKLPLITKIVIKTSSFVISHLILIVTFLVLLGTSLFTLYKKGKFDELLLKVPFFGKIILFSNLQRFFSVLSALMKSGISFVESIEISSETIGNSKIRKDAKRIKSEIEKGKSFASSLKNFMNYVPYVLIQLVEAGETSGELPELLSKCARFLEEEIATRTSKINSLMEPVVLLVVGGVVGFIVYSLLLPIITMSIIVHR
jgi:type II secretory pathway component PulF